MEKKDIITSVLAIFSFVLGGIIVYYRENRKLFQEKIFENKINAYKEILEEIGIYYEDVFRFLEYFQEYEKTENEWNIDSLPFFKEYYKKAYDLKRLYYKNLVLLPESQLVKLDKLLSRCISHITNHSHIRTAFPHDSYGNLYDQYIEFAEQARQDISINILNISLNKRLVESFYPISLPKKSKQKTQQSGEDQE